MNDQISIIVPIYNTEKYLPKCIDSILSQTHTNLQIILVDDGSTDASGEICDEYAGKDNRIMVIRQNHKGVSAARNAGVAAAVGQYVMFVDSDDYVHPDFCRHPYLYAKQNNADLVLFDYEPIGSKKYKYMKPKSGIKTTGQAIDSLFTYNNQAVWNKLFLASTVKQLSFIEGYLYEDIDYLYKAILVSNKVYYLNEVLYYHVWRAGSITQTVSYVGLRDWFEMTMNQYNDLRSRGLDSKYVYNNYLSVAMKYLISCSKADNLKEAAQKIVTDATVINGLRALPFKRKLLFIVLKISPMAFDCICNGFRRRIF